jgi:hypothetical protein
LASSGGAVGCAQALRAAAAANISMIFFIVEFP